MRCLNIKGKKSNVIIDSPSFLNFFITASLFKIVQKVFTSEKHYYHSFKTI